MFTVSILINGRPIFTRSAVNRGSSEDSFCDYQVDDGTTIKHNPADGAIVLAHKMLDLIKEQK